MLHKTQHPSPSLLTIFGKPQITDRQGKYSAEVKNTVGYYCEGHLLDYHAWLSARGHTPLNIERYGQSSDTCVYDYHDDKSPTGAQLWTLPQANQTTNSTKHQTKLQLQLFPLQSRATFTVLLSRDQQS